jgi:hypothetical protein
MEIRMCLSHWADLLQTLLPMALSVAALLISLNQFFTERASLKSSLFEERIQVYKAVRAYLANQLMSPG